MSNRPTPVPQGPDVARAEAAVTHSERRAINVGSVPDSVAVERLSSVARFEADTRSTSGEAETPATVWPWSVSSKRSLGYCLPERALRS
jgi:Tfp pilus assembly protein PilX